jgi:type I restriction enzyme S subunit
MNPELLLNHFNRISDALDAIPRLRAFILDLAVRGKLVEQDPKDEPASELLARIQREKARLVKSGVIRPGKPLAEVEDCDLFQLPKGWAWTRWEAIALKIGDIDHKMPETVAEGVPFVSPRDFLPGNRIDFDGAKRISFEDFARLSAKTRPAIGDLIYPRYGTIGENRLATDERDFLVSYSCAVIKVLVGFIDAKYQYFYSVSSFCRGQAKAAENKTTQANVGIKSIQEFVVPLPPLPEQHRIVAKVDELMALCDRVEAMRAETESHRDRLAAASLHHLNNGANAEVLRVHANFYVSHLPCFTTRPNQLKELRRTILNLAVRGRLVNQDPNDEPASQLLRRVNTERGRLAKEGKVPQQKPLPPIEETTVPFSLPNGWSWARLGSLCRLVTSGSRDWAKFYSNEGAIFLRMGNLSRDSYQLRLHNIQRVKPPADSEGARTKLQQGDILISITGEVGLLGLIPNDFEESYINQHTCLVRPMDELRHRYLPELFRSPFAQNQFDEPQRGLKNSFRLTDVTHFLVPLPPLAEQHRIVAKVDELMVLCGRLETELAMVQDDGSRLLDAVLHDALNNNQGDMDKLSAAQA